jgi:hypothetical protein
MQMRIEMVGDYLENKIFRLLPTAEIVCSDNKLIFLDKDRFVENKFWMNGRMCLKQRWKVFFV